MPAPRAAGPSGPPTDHRPDGGGSVLGRLASRFWLPALLLLLAALIRPNQVVAALRSPMVWLVVAAVVVLAVVLTRVGTRLGGPVLGRLLGALPAVAVLVFVLLPSATSGSVDEALPGLAPAGAPGGAAAGAAAADGAAAAPDVAAQPDGAAPGGGTAHDGATDAAAGAAGAGPVVLGEGEIAGIGHDAEGLARLVRLEDGSSVVRFERFAVESGPDYRVWVVPGAGHEEPTDDGVELGALKGSSGNQNYPVPEGALPADGGPVSVLVWCRAFSVPVAAATVPAG